MRFSRERRFSTSSLLDLFKAPVGSSANSPLGLAARDLGRETVFRAAHAHLLQQGHCALCRLLGWALLPYIARHRHVFKEGQIADQMGLLEYKTEFPAPQVRHLILRQAVDFFAFVSNLASGNTVHAAESVQQCGFSGSGGTHDHRKIVFVDRDVDPVKDCYRRAVLRKGFAECASLQQSLFHGGSSLLCFY